MNWYKKAQSNDQFFEDTPFSSAFDHDPEEVKRELQEIQERKRHEIIDPPTQREVELILYRGFRYLPPANEDGTYTFSPDKSEQEALWFTHSFISGGYDAENYAKAHGDYLLTYPLMVIKHYQRICYDNNEDCREITPEAIKELSDPSENCRFYAGYELPEGWFFSYKMEKFITCSVPLTVSKEMITKIQEQNELV